MLAMKRDGVWSPEGQYYGPHTFSDGDGEKCRVDEGGLAESGAWRFDYASGAIHRTLSDAWAAFETAADPPLRALNESRALRWLDRQPWYEPLGAPARVVERVVRWAFR